MLGAVSVATACVLPGSVAAARQAAASPTSGTRRIEVEHPTGFFTVEIDVGTGDGTGGRDVNRSALLRTARKLMRGEVYVPARVWERRVSTATRDRSRLHRLRRGRPDARRGPCRARHRDICAPATSPSPTRAAGPASLRPRPRRRAAQRIRAGAERRELVDQRRDGRPVRSRPPAAASGASSQHGACFVDLNSCHPRTKVAAAADRRPRPAAATSRRR